MTSIFQALHNRLNAQWLEVRAVTDAMLDSGGGEVEQEGEKQEVSLEGAAQEVHGQAASVVERPRGRSVRPGSVRRGSQVSEAIIKTLSYDIWKQHNESLINDGDQLE